MKRNFILIAGFSWLIGGAPCVGQFDCPQLGSENAKVSALLIELRKTSNGQAIAQGNTHLYIKSAEIEAVVRSGPDVLDLLLVAMDAEATDFDSFARCYSCCDQIIRKTIPGTQIFWLGRCPIRLVDGEFRVFPRQVPNELEFRKAIVDDIRTKVLQVQQKVKTGTS